VVERGAPAKAQARPRQPGPPTADGAVEAIGKGAPHLGRWLMLKSRALKPTRGLRAGRRAVGRTVTQRPDAPPPDDGGPGDPRGEATAVFVIGQDRGRQRQATAGQPCDHTVVAQGTEQAREGQRGKVQNGRTPCEAEATVGSEQGLARHRGTPAAIAQDAVRQDRQDRLARGALEAPDGEPAQSHPSRMGVAGQTPTTGAGRLVGELKAQGKEKSKDACDKCLALVHPLHVGGWRLEIDRDGTVLAGRFSVLSHGSSSVAMAVGADETSWG